MNKKAKTHTNVSEEQQRTIEREKKCGRCKALRQVVFIIFKTLVDVISSSLPFVNLFFRFFFLSFFHFGYVQHPSESHLKSITDCSPFLYVILIQFIKLFHTHSFFLILCVAFSVVIPIIFLLLIRFFFYFVQFLLSLLCCSSFVCPILVFAAPV